MLCSPASRSSSTAPCLQCPARNPSRAAPESDTPCTRHLDGAMPSLPSPPPPASNTPQKVSNGSRPSTAHGPGSKGTPRAQQNGEANKLRPTKVRAGASVDETAMRASRAVPAGKDGIREKAPSKDGTVQRTAKEVEGLKDFVRERPPQSSTCCVYLSKTMAYKKTDISWVSCNNALPKWTA